MLKNKFKKINMNFTSFHSGVSKSIWSRWKTTYVITCINIQLQCVVCDTNCTVRTNWMYDTDVVQGS